MQQPMKKKRFKNKTFLNFLQSSTSHFFLSPSNQGFMNSSRPAAERDQLSWSARPLADPALRITAAHSAIKYACAVPRKTGRACFHALSPLQKQTRPSWIYRWLDLSQYPQFHSSGFCLQKRAEETAHTLAEFAHGTFRCSCSEPRAPGSAGSSLVVPGQATDSVCWVRHRECVPPLCFWIHSPPPLTSFR